MYSILLIIIYIAFISLGLPDSLLGAGWAVMHIDLSVPVSYAGILSMLISVFTIVSSLFCSKIIAKIGSGLYTFLSVLLTALAMIGFAFSKSFWILVVLTIPYGLGAGGVDATLNNFVALHYKARHMSWLHCFWGVGAIISPYIMGYFLRKSDWHSGYLLVGILQIVLSLVILFSLPVWKKTEKKDCIEKTTKPLSIKQIFSIKGVVVWMVCFFGYCAVEQTTMLWAGTYLVNFKSLDADIGAIFSSFVFIGLTLGRLICGFVAEKSGDKKLIRIGYCIALGGLILIAIPIKNAIPSLVGFLVAGLGFAPIYPCIIHATPDNFGKENSQSIIGVQMAFAYLGITLMPPIFGVIAEKISVGLLPLYGLILMGLLIVCCEIFYYKKKKSEGVSEGNS